MTLHLPAQHAGLSGHEWLKDLLIVGGVILATVLVVGAAMALRPAASSTTVESQALIEYRAAERAGVSAPVQVTIPSDVGPPAPVPELRAE